jgi:hypothetical protein
MDWLASRIEQVQFQDASISQLFPGSMKPGRWDLTCAGIRCRLHFPHVKPLSWSTPAVFGRLNAGTIDSELPFILFICVQLSQDDHGLLQHHSQIAMASHNRNKSKGAFSILSIDTFRSFSRTESRQGWCILIPRP